MDNSPVGDEISILTWMDDLLDTRLSTMLRYNIKKTMEAIPKGYDLRTADNFIWDSLGITEQVWNHLWDNRDDEILYHSRRTGTPDFFRELLSEHLRETTGIPGKLPIRLTVNTWPYALTNEVQDAWRDVYRELIHPLLNVKFIRKSYKQLTPGYVMSNFNYLVHYDWDKWATAVSEGDEKVSMTTLTVIGPRIFKSAPDEEELAKFGEELEHFDIHMLAEIAIALVFQLRLVPVDMWVAFKDNHEFSTKAKGEDTGGVPQSV